MNTKRILARGSIFLVALVILYHLGYRPVVYWRDNNLAERAEKIHQGMTMQEVAAVLGKPKEECFLSIEAAKSRVPNKKKIDEIANKDQKVLFQGYWVPMLLRMPFFLRSTPAKTIVEIFYDENGNVALISIGVAVTGGIFLGGYGPDDWE